MGRKADIVYKILMGACFLACCPVLLYVGWLGCRALLCDQFVTPTRSMEPALLPGDRILVDKTIMGARIYKEFEFDPKGQELKAWRTRGTRSVRRNDVLVFNYPLHGGKISFVINHVYAKRCIGLPGDSVSIVNGFFKNNNCKDGIGFLPAQERLSGVRDEDIVQVIYDVHPKDKHLPWSVKNMPAVYVPRRGDIIDVTPKEGCLYRAVLEWETGCRIEVRWDENRVLADGKPLERHTFKHNYYYVVGDRVMDSADSRYWGVLPEEYIIGVATHICYSIDKQTGERRKGRFLQPINGGGR